MLDHLAEHRRCALFAGMGSGKTSAVLHGLNAIGVMDEGPGLIVGPKRVARDVWPSEASKWDSLPGIDVTPVIGTQTERFAALGRDTLWHAINYDNLPWLLCHFKDQRKKWPYRTIVADESTRLKGMRERGQGGKRTNALAAIAWMPQVRRFIELTGTPAPNGLKDLWGQLWFLDHGERLGTSYTSFKERWFQRAFDGHGIDPLPFAQEQIQEAIKDICLTVDPRDYISIDEPIETDIEIELPPKAMDIYRQMERQMFVELEHDFQMHEVEAPHAAARTSKCLQIAAGFLYNEERLAIPVHEEKLDALDSIREEANGMPLLISYIFRHDLAMLKRKFPQLRHIDEVSEKEWNAGHVPMMAAHPVSIA
jgi:hypothetical protein